MSLLLKLIFQCAGFLLFVRKPLIGDCVGFCLYVLLLFFLCFIFLWLCRNLAARARLFEWMRLVALDDIRMGECVTQFICHHSDQPCLVWYRNDIIQLRAAGRIRKFRGMRVGRRSQPRITIDIYISSYAHSAARLYVFNVWMNPNLYGSRAYIIFSVLT